MATLGQFFTDVLSGLGAPASSADLATLANVSQTEGVNDYYNPFNIEWHPGDNTAYEGVGNFNSVGVQEYGSYAQGVAATDAFLQTNSRWSSFVNALKTGGGANSQLQAAYTWATVKQASPTQAASLLSKDIGTGTPGSVAKTTGGDPPYDPASLNPSSLSVEQASNMYAWLVAYTAAHGGGSPSVASWNALSAADKITAYSSVYAIYKFSNTGIGGPSLPSIPGLGSVEGLITDLEKSVLSGAWWKRVGVGVLGAVVVGVAIYLLLRSDNIGPSPKQLAETAAIA